MKNAEEKQVFEVNEVEHASGVKWKLRGRSYMDLQLGNILYAYVNSGAEPLPFEVVEIRAFSKNLTEISHGYASELVVKGIEGENLNKIDHLYML